MGRRGQNDNAPLVKRGSTDIYIVNSRMAENVEPQVMPPEPR
jgi:hypothetical protein